MGTTWYADLNSYISLHYDVIHAKGSFHDFNFPKATFLNFVLTSSSLITILWILYRQQWMLKMSYLRHRHNERNLQEWARKEDLLFIVLQDSRDLVVQKLNYELIFHEVFSYIRIY